MIAPGVEHVDALLAGRAPAQGRVEAACVDAAVPARDLLGATPIPASVCIGRGAGGEHEVARAVEGAYADRHRIGDAPLARAQAGVGGQLGVIAAEQRHAEAAADERADDADRTGRADVDQVEAPVGERLHGGRQARHADLQARVVGHLELGDGREAAVDVWVGADDLDLEAAHAARADLLDGARDAVRRADAVGEDRDARRLAVLAPRVELGPLVGEEGRRRGVRDRRGAALEQVDRGARRSSPLAAGGGERVLDRDAQLALVRAARAPVEVCVAEAVILHVRDQADLVEVVELDGAEPRVQQAARVGR